MLCRPVPRAANSERAARQRARGSCGNVDDEQVRHALILFGDLEFTVLLVAVLHRRRLWLGRRIRDRLAVGGPREISDAVVEARQRVGFTALRADQINLPFVAAVGDEGELGPVWRPCRRLAGFFRVGQLTSRAAGRIGEPDLRFVRVVVPVRLANRVRHQASVRRDLRRARALQRKDLIDCRDRSGRRRALCAEHGRAAKRNSSQR